MAYRRRRTITIPASQVSAAQTDFPVLFSRTFTDLKSSANGGSIQNVNGYDIAFTSDVAGTTLLNFDVEYWGDSTGQLVAWIKIPSLSNVTDNVFYLHYSDNSVTTFQGNKNGTWNSNYKAVWHMATGPLTDSTLNSNNANTGSATYNQIGLFGRATSFNGSQVVGGPHSASLDFSQNVLIEAVVNMAAVSADTKPLVQKDGGFSGAGLYALDINANEQVSGAFSYGTSSGQNPRATGSTVISVNTWVYLVMRYDKSAVKVYLNGSENGSTNATNNILTANSSWYLGARDGGYFNGSMEEVRIMNGASAPAVSYITVNNKNLMDNANFMSVSDAIYPSFSQVIFYG